MTAILMQSRHLVVLMIILSCAHFNAMAQHTILDSYINQAIESNSALKQKQLSYEKSLLSLKEAKRMFFPTVSIIAEYSFNSGGIVIDMPFGNMLNPVYDNLNLVNGINSAQIPNYPNIPAYPTIENVEVLFLQEKEQRTQIQLEMPIYNKALVHNKKLQEQLSEVKKISAETYKRELIKQVKSAYLDYKIALQTMDVGNRALELVITSLAVSNSLYENDKITIDEVYKAEAKVKEVKNKILEINKGITLTKAYFNFLLNRRHDDEIEIDKNTPEQGHQLFDLDELMQAALEKRDELKLLDYSIQINNTQINIEKSAALPLFYLNASTGFWSTDYSYNDKSVFRSISASMKWDIFTSGQTKSKIEQAEVDRQISFEKRRELENNISLEVVEAFYNVKTAKESVALSALEKLNYGESLKIIEKKKRNGLASQLEYDIAFMDFFESEINHLNNQNKYFQKIIELEFVINK